MTPARASASWPSGDADVNGRYEGEFRWPLRGCGGTATALRKHSAAPEVDVARLFRQMAFNAAIGNTNDHLKNFWMYRDISGYRLTPAFDLVPDVGARGEHVLVFLDSAAPPGRQALLEVARRWNVKDAAAALDEVCAAAEGFSSAAGEAGVPQADITRIGADIGRRLLKIGTST